MRLLEGFISSSSFEEVICLSSVNIASSIYDTLKQEGVKLFYSSNLDEKTKRLQEKSKSQPIIKIVDLFGKYQEDIKNKAIKGISGKIQKLKLFNTVPLTTIYALIRNPIDIEASANLASFLIELFDISFQGNLLYPSYFKRLQD